MVLIDSSVWIEALRRSGSEEIREHVSSLVQSKEAAWCAAIRLELWPGMRDLRERKILNQFRSIVADLPITSAVWESAIDLAERARSRGVSCPYADLLIHSCAKTHKAELLHRDQHFDRLAKL